MGVIPMTDLSHFYLEEIESLGILVSEDEEWLVPYEVLFPLGSTLDWKCLSDFP